MSCTPRETQNHLTQDDPGDKKEGGLAWSSELCPTGADPESRMGKKRFSGEVASAEGDISPALVHAAIAHDLDGVERFATAELAARLKDWRSAPDVVVEMLPLLIKQEVLGEPRAQAWLRACDVVKETSFCWTTSSWKGNVFLDLFLALEKMAYDMRVVQKTMAHATMMSPNRVRNHLRDVSGFVKQVTNKD